MTDVCPSLTVYDDDFWSGPTRNPRFDGSIVIVASHFIQYQAPFFRRLAELGAPIHVLYLSDHPLQSSAYDPDFQRDTRWDVDLTSGYSWTVLEQGSPPGGQWRAVPRIRRELRALGPDAVLVHGWGSPGMRAALGWCLSAQKRVLLRTDTAAVSMENLGRLKRVLASWAARLPNMYCLSTSTTNDRFYALCGVARHRRVPSPHAVDNEFFGAVSSDAVWRFRSEYGTEGRPQVLFAGKLVSHKGIDVLLAAAQALKDVADFIVVGDGPLAGPLHEARLASLRTIGFLNQTGLRTAYAASDLLFLPSRRERFGLVIAENLSHGGATVASSRVGAVEDLIRIHENGELFNSDDPGSAILALERALEIDRQRVRTVNRRLRSRWNYDAAASGIADALAR